MSAASAMPSWTLSQAAHLLNRAGFGGTPEEIARLHALGRGPAVRSLLESGDDTDLFPTPPLTSAAGIAAYQREVRKLPDGDPAKREKQAAFRRQQNGEVRELRSWWLNRMRYTPNALREKMTLFWHGHFATSFDKVNLAFLMWQQNETLRAFALGKFRHLTEEISRDPAMMRYLDLARSERDKPNENFARELMELFTLGEGVRYSEKDVQESARAFTGYRINQENLQFRFVARKFDDSPKEFMGHSGNLRGAEVIDIICAQPECAQFITRKIWDFLAGVPARPELIDRLAWTYHTSDYDTSVLLAEIFTSPEFYAPSVVGHQVKSPVQWLVQTSKHLNAPLCPPQVNEQVLRQMGQVLFAPPNVKGWEGGESWINSSTFLLRCNLAGEMVHGPRKVDAARSPSLYVDWAELAPLGMRADSARLLDTLSWRFLNAPLPAEDQERFISFIHERGTSDSALSDLVHLILSTPEYQLT